MKINFLVIVSMLAYCNFSFSDNKTYMDIIDEMNEMGKEAERRTQEAQEKMLRENLERMELEDKRKKAQEEYEKSNEYKKAQKEKEARNKKAVKIREKCAKKAKDYKNESAAQDAIAACLQLEGYWD